MKKAARDGSPKAIRPSRLIGVPFREREDDSRRLRGLRVLTLTTRVLTLTTGILTLAARVLTLTTGILACLGLIACAPALSPLTGRRHHRGASGLLIARTVGSITCPRRFEVFRLARVGLLPGLLIAQSFLDRNQAIAVGVPLLELIHRPAHGLPLVK